MRSFAAALILASALMPLAHTASPAQTSPSPWTGTASSSDPVANPLSNQIRVGPSGGGQAGGGQAAPPVAGPLLMTITPDTTMRILKGVGFTDVELYKDGESVAVKVTGAEVDSYVWHENCKNGQCVTLWFVCNYGKQESIDAAFINDYNLNTIYTKMSISGSGDLLLSMAGSLYNGVSEAHVRGLGELWLTILKEAMEYKPKGR